jgi:hypothetical protein
MSVESRAGLGVLLLAALLVVVLVVVLVDTFPRKYRDRMLAVLCVLNGAFLVWVSL